MGEIDPWMSGRMGGTGKEKNGEYKVRDTRTHLRGGQKGPRGLSWREKRRMRQEIRQFKKTESSFDDHPSPSGAPISRTVAQTPQDPAEQRHAPTPPTNSDNRDSNNPYADNRFTRAMRITIALLSSACVVVVAAMYLT